MPEKKDAQPDVRTELEEMVAREIGDAEGERDSVALTLAKAMSGALDKLLPFEKGQKTPTKAAGAKPDQDIEEEVEDGDEKPGDEPKAVSDKPEEMNLGTDFDDDLGFDDAPEYFDATEFLTSLQAENRQLRKAVSGLTGEVKALRKAMDEQNTSLRSDMGGVLGELAKGVVGTQQLLRDTPMAPVMSPTQNGMLRVVGGNMGEKVQKAALTNELLVKAMARGVIDDMDLNYFRKNGSFSADEKENASILEAVRATG